jgi:hypothetical protein
VAEGPPQQKALIGPVDTTSFTGGYDFSSILSRFFSSGMENRIKML